MIGALNNVVNADLDKLNSSGNDWRYVYVIVDGAASGVRILPIFYSVYYGLVFMSWLFWGGSPNVIGA